MQARFASKVRNTSCAMATSCTSVLRCKNMKKLIGLFTLSVLFVAATALKSGDAAPDFSAKNQDGKTIQLSDLKGKYVLLYFYPKDDTPGCTKEACKFRDGFDLIKRHNVVVLGVSKQ